MKITVIEIILLGFLVGHSIFQGYREKKALKRYSYIRYVLLISFLLLIGQYITNIIWFSGGIPIDHLFWDISILNHIFVTFVSVYYLFFYFLSSILTFLSKVNGLHFLWNMELEVERLQKKRILCNTGLLFYTLLVHGGSIISIMFKIYFK
jgi:hypothetical protein